MRYNIRNLLKLYRILIFSVLFFTQCKQEDSPVNDSGTRPPANVEIKPSDFLSENSYTKLTVEITYVEGYKPTAKAISGLKTFLENILHKSGGINILTSAIASPGKTSYSLSDIQEVEKNFRTRFAKEENLAAWFFFADADYAGNEGDSKVLGVAYSSTSMAIFEKTIQEFSGGLGEPSISVLEETVTEHEFGHILGLVNNGTGMVENHQDTAHGKHCDNKNCLMYYSAEHSSGIVNFLSGGNVPALDSRCLEDLKNNGGK